MAMFRPILPRELVLNERASTQYRDWLLDPSRKTVAVVVGRPGIGKETMVGLFHRLHNYSERLIDGTELREDTTRRIEEMRELVRERDMHGRKLVVVSRDLDGLSLQRVLEIKRSVVPIVVILDDLPRRLADMSHVEVIRCYLDSFRVMQRAEKICQKKKIVLPEVLRERIRSGEKIRKVIAEIDIYQASERVRSVAQVETGRMGGLEIVKALLFSRGDKRKRYSDVETICERNDLPNVGNLLFENYLEKCLTLEDACQIAETVSLADRPFRETKTLAIYKQHLMLYNELAVSFKLPQKGSTVSRKNGLVPGWIYGGVPQNSWFFPFYAKELAGLFVRKIKQAAMPSRVDAYTKRALLGFLSGVRKLDLLDDQTMETLVSIESAEPAAGPTRLAIPRYVYKDGHSHYVTRDILIQEIIQLHH
ncbi:hypothetical protein NEHOM01_0776 [Nematocida homosporus]|uniref:uncharacterized protein n=1 Tax=Nematocida homosporus TaxID=1912981 RepID=UPI00221EAAB6|nr:uncharacterized protein NEHOM01_0776 [Nematocida homosporus]KAI5185361.1 hypothetical protein NEHOM01_0776 [Nematocida homosporus]